MSIRFAGIRGPEVLGYEMHLIRTQIFLCVDVGCLLKGKLWMMPYDVGWVWEVAGGDMQRLRAYRNIY